jgi:hypothetical protein
MSNSMKSSKQHVALHRGDNCNASAAATEGSGVTPAEHSDGHAMKPAKSSECAPSGPKPGPAKEPEPWKNHSPVWAVEHSALESYQHWGINE